LFRRTKSEDTTTATPAEPEVKTAGKGRPTPTRKEAEAAARARAKGVATTKQEARQRRAEQSRRMREAMRTGDERYLPSRDRGKVRRFIRDYIDSRLSMAEFLLPLLVVIMIAQALGQLQLANGLWIATIVLVGLDTVYLLFTLRRALKKRFPGESLGGSTYYAILRAMQIRFLRQPKPQVKLGQRP
jgi:hypothetical protein